MWFLEDNCVVRTFGLEVSELLPVECILFLQLSGSFCPPCGQVSTVCGHFYANKHQVTTSLTSPPRPKQESLAEVAGSAADGVPTSPALRGPGAGRWGHALDAAKRSKRSTITKPDVLAALEDMGFAHRRAGQPPGPAGPAALGAGGRGGGHRGTTAHGRMPEAVGTIALLCGPAPAR